MFIWYGYLFLFSILNFQNSENLFASGKAKLFLEIHCSWNNKKTLFDYQNLTHIRVYFQLFDVFVSKKPNYKSRNMGEI